MTMPRHFTRKTKRKTLTDRARVRIFDAADGICHICGLGIDAERGAPWDVDHIKPLWAGGCDEEFNMGPVHASCHQRKNGTDNTDRCKADRIRAAHIGATGPGKGSHPMPFGAKSHLKKKIGRGFAIRENHSAAHRRVMKERYFAERHT